MSLGYETYEDNRSFEQDGLTGNVKRYSISSMMFPCYIINSTEDKPVKVHNVKTLHQMLPKSESFNNDLANNMINIYIVQDGRTARLGAIKPSQVKTFLRLFKNNEVDGYVDENTKLEGMYLYILAD